MKSPNNHVTRSVGAACLVLAALLSCSTDAETGGNGAGRRVEVSLVERNAVMTFLNRLAVAQGHVVATRKAVASAKEHTTVREDIGTALYLVEGAALEAELRGELARVGGVAIVAAERTVDIHDWLGSSAYFAEAIADTETTDSSSQGPTAINNPTRDAGSATPFPGPLPEGSGSSSPSPPPSSPPPVSPPPSMPPASDAGAPPTRDGGGPTAPPMPFVPVVERAYLEKNLRELSGATPTDIGNGPFTLSERGSNAGRVAARAWMRRALEALKFTVVEQPFVGGVNLVADRMGANTKKALILSAHYDSVQNAGADDDASGIISAFGVAHALRAASLTRGLRIVAFDLEEKGLVGSKAYVDAVSKANKLGEIVGVLNLEMTGYDSVAPCQSRCLHEPE
jgi:uncharacterized protein with GYD domain